MSDLINFDPSGLPGVTGIGFVIAIIMQLVGKSALDVVCRFVCWLVTSITKKEVVPGVYWEETARPLSINIAAWLIGYFVAVALGVKSFEAVITGLVAMSTATGGYEVAKNASFILKRDR